MPKRVYKFRVVGMALGGLPIAVVLLENKASILYWLWWMFSCLIWPHLAYFLAVRNSNPFKIEKYNLTFDSFIAGIWMPLMHFNLLPSLLLIIITLADKVSSGIRKLWLYALYVIAFAILVGAIFTGFAFKPQSSIAVILACIPIITIHTLLVSIGSFQLIRKVQKQNAMLAKLSQNDTLTSLYNRRHWQQQVENLMESCENSDKLATLMIIDIDNFKKINDNYGHSVGDDILKDVADIIIISSPDKATIGRLGGDEFALVVPMNKVKSAEIANTIVKFIKNYQHDYNKDLKFTLSIGLAEIDNNCDYRLWFDTADKALYQAKNLGRNRIIVAE